MMPTNSEPKYVPELFIGVVCDAGDSAKKVAAGESAEWDNEFTPLINRTALLMAKRLQPIVQELAEVLFQETKSEFAALNDGEDLAEVDDMLELEEGEPDEEDLFAFRQAVRIGMILAAATIDRHYFKQQLGPDAELLTQEQAAEELKRLLQNRWSQIDDSPPSDSGSD